MVRRGVRSLVGALGVVAVVATGLTAILGVEAIGAPAAAAQTSFTFNGGGWGHGVGMSQYGAKGRADAGHTAAQILEAYYPGAALETRSVGGPRVKLGDPTGSDLSTSGGPIYGTPDGGPTAVIANAGERLSLRMFGTALISQRVDNGPGPVNVLTTGGTRYTISWDPGQTLSVGLTGRAYAHGSIRVIPASATYGMIVQGLTMQQYLYGLGEMPASWAAEALRAQAVAGRTYAANKMAARASQTTDWDVAASVSDQVYNGTTQSSGTNGANWVAAVDATDGQVLMSGGQPIQAFYSSSNGGHSERSDYVFTAGLPYLTATPDSFDQNSANPNASWSRTFTGDELGAWFSAAGRGAVGSVTAVTIGGNVGASGRVDKATFTVTGTAGTTTMTGNQFRSAINGGSPNDRDLLSTKFGPGLPPTPPPPPPDTTAPDLKVLVGNPMRFGTSGNICAFVLSDEVAITAIHIRLGRTDLKSRVGGVGPTFPQLMCINIPPKLRPKRATNVVLTGAALDAAVNMRFVQQTVTIAK